MAETPRTAVMNIRVPFATHAANWLDKPRVTGWDSALNQRYAEALVRELEANADEFADVEVTAVRIGGGQASHLGGQAIWSIARAVRGLYRLAEDAPLTMRAAASDFSGASMPLFRRAGVARFDLEMLTLAPTAFHRVNHQDALDLYPVLCNSFLHSAANDSLGLVLLAGTPEASDIETRRSFLAAHEYNAAHVIVERCRGTGADDARTDAQVADARSVLEAAGLHEYLPLRFARAGCEDRFFARCAAGDDVIGIGLGARTRFDGALSTNTADLDTYLAWSGDFTKITADVRPA